MMIDRLGAAIMVSHCSITSISDQPLCWRDGGARQSWETPS
jgi:hypothetical protein